MRIIRFVGHPSPLDDHNVWKRLKNGTLDPQIALAFESFEHNRRVAARRGASVLKLGRESGLSRDYQWGPTYFDAEVEEADWAKISRNSVDRFMFLDVTAGVPPFRPLLTQREWRELLEAVRDSPPPKIAATNMLGV